MDLRQLVEKQKKDYDQLVNHVVQSWEWGDFRKSLGMPVLRYGLYRDNKLTRAFQLDLHKIPFTNYFVGYLPKGDFPDKELAQALTQIAKENHCAFIKVEPNVPLSIINLQSSEIDERFIKSPKPLFTKHNFILDLTKSDDEILKNMHQKFRYNIKVAQKHGVIVEERTDDEALEIHLKLYFDTTSRQSYHGHDKNYHQKVWQTLKKAGIIRVLIAFYTNPETQAKIPLCSWMLFNFKDTFYYPYGGSSDLHKNVMASNLVAWEAIKLGKKLGLKKLDLWGAVGPDTPKNHPWQGFHRFKSQMGGELVEYIGSYDLILNKPLYWLFTLIDTAMPLKLFLLKILGK